MAKNKKEEVLAEVSVSEEFTGPVRMLDAEEQKIIYVPLSDIYPSPTNPRKYFDPAGITEMARSARKHGIIQPVTLRHNPAGNITYELVCGERRWRGSTEAKLESIPAIIRVLSDDEVLELQFQENLNRRDVHPMDEAVTFKAMVDSGKYMIADIAAKVMKSEVFVVGRLSLNSLVGDLQKDFWSDRFQIGTAVLFARLTADDQKYAHKFYKDRSGGYAAVGDVKNFVDQQIIRKLSSAPFKRDDATLLKKAGACTNCPKRSGCNTLLFHDIQDDDRCFDKVCFQQKLDAWLLNKVEKTLQENPDVLLVDYGYGNKVLPGINKMAAEYKVAVLNYQKDDISTYQDSGKKPAKALWVSGNDVGKVKTIYIKKSGKEKGKKDEARTSQDVEQELAGVKQRQSRALELDSEKVWGQVKQLIEKPANLTNLQFYHEELLQVERNAMAYALVEKMTGDEYLKAAFAVLGIKQGKSARYYSNYLDKSDLQNISNVSDTELKHLLRLFILSTLRDGISHLTAKGPIMLMPVLKRPAYLEREVQRIEADQAAIAAKRLERVTKRISDLKQEITDFSPQKGGKVEKADKGKKDKSPIAKGIATLLENSHDEKD